MKNWILVAGYNRRNFEAAQKEWIKYNISLHSVNTIPEAIAKFSERNYLAVIASVDLPDMMLIIEAMREKRNVPLLVLSQEDSGTKMAESIINGSDMFIIDTDNLIESIKNSKDIIERLSKLSPHNRHSLGILTHRDIFMLYEYRKVYVHKKEVALAKSEFEILHLLLSQVGRVFTYEQIYLNAYGENVATDITINSVRCHISRIRQRLRNGQKSEDYIMSVRSVGYQIAV